MPVCEWQPFALPLLTYAFCCRIAVPEKPVPTFSRNAPMYAALRFSKSTTLDSA